MASKTITIKESTYKNLKRWKENGESFSDMLDREFKWRFETARDLLEWARFEEEERREARTREKARRSRK